jgi:dTDP-4-dehydrorhamnose reductase
MGGYEVLAPSHAELDVTDADRVRDVVAGFKPDVVIHTAAWTETAGCEGDPALAMRVNGEATGLIAELCERAGAAIVYISTNEVFDGDKGSPYTEDDPPNPINAYGRSKLDGEERVKGAAKRWCIVRTSWLHGPGRDSFPEKIIAAAQKQDVLRTVTDEIASPTFTQDLAGAIVRLIDEEATGVFHLTNTGICSRKEWAEEVLRLAGISVPVEPVTQAEYGTPYQKPAFSALANTNAARHGIELRPWQEALAAHLHAAKTPEGARP